MAEKINFTQQRIEKLPTPEKNRVDYQDTGCKKLVCRVSPTGIKSFCVLKRTASGKLQRITLGRYPDISVSQARKLAIGTLSKIAEGLDPNEEKRKARYRAITLQELLDTYLGDKRDLREASILDYKKKINQGFSDWLNKPINTITREMVKIKRNKFTGGVDNKMRVLRLLMNYAVHTLKAIDESPVDVLTNGKLWGKLKRKQRTIQTDQLCSWYKAVEELDNEKAKVYLLLLLHTGLRDQDVRYLKWQDIDIKNNCLIARDTKNHSDFTTYIAPQIVPHIRNLKTSTGNSQFVFPGANKKGVMGIPRKQITQVCKKTELKFSSHDLKRTFLTMGEAAGVPFSLLKALANHKKDNDVTSGYINTEQKTMKKSIFKIADYIHHYVKPEK